MLDEVRSALRIDGYEHDAELQGLIEAAVADLTLSGVDPQKAQAMTDPLIKRAIIIYCRMHFEYSDASAERLERSYQMLKAHLALAEDYRAGGSADA